MNEQKKEYRKLEMTIIEMNHETDLLLVCSGPCDDGYVEYID